MRKTLSVVLTLAMLLSTFAFAAPAPASVETAAELAGVTVEAEAAPVEEPTEDVAVLEATAPGLNIFTGTTAALDYESVDSMPLFAHGNFPSWGVTDNSILEWDGSVKADQPTGNDSAKIFYLKSAEATSPYQSFYIKSIFDAGRKYEISFDEYSNNYEAEGTGEKRRWSEAGGWFINFKGNNSHISIANTKTENITNNKWATRKYTETASSAGLAQAQVQLKVCTDNNPRSWTAYGYWYFDNFAIYPYYRVNYYGADGAVASSEQFLRDGNDDFITSYTAKTDNYPIWTINDGTIRNCIGWATTPGATEAVSDITLSNADVNLYPVWETVEFLTGEKIMKLTSGNSTIITAAEPVTWAYDLGFTNATVTPVEGFEDTQIAVTSTGRNGEVVLTATLISDPTTSYNATVILAGESYWIPGVNFFTGTTEPYTFENLTAAQVSYTFGINGNNTQYVANPTPDARNSSAMVAKITNATYASLWQTDSLVTPIDNARPILINYDFIGITANHWVMKNGSDAGDVGLDFGPSTNGSWAHITSAKNLNLKNTNDVTKLAFEGSFTPTTNYLCFDNFSAIPFYKVTYMDFDNETVVATEYVLVDSDNNIITAFAPNVGITGDTSVTGYSLTAGGEITTSVALNNEDIVLYPVGGDYLIFTDGENTYSESLEEYVDGDYTLPTIASMGLSTENFRVWVDEAGNKYTDGQVISEETLANLANKTLTAYYQDATAPAMGFSYEGDTAASASKYKKTEVTTDMGRTVFHARQEASTWASTRWMNDARMTVKQSFNSYEYNVFQFSFRTANGINLKDNSTPAASVTPDMLVPVTNAPMIIYYFTSNENNGYYTPGGEHRVGNKIYDIDSSDSEYTLLEVDMGVASNGNSAAVWAADQNSKVYGFAFDTNRVYYSGDSYIDYIRVYRDGIFTVNYDSNFPEGADLTGATNVAADEGRGAGVGYMLKGQYPTLNDASYKFLGWGTTPDATETVESIDLVGDATVYGVWTKLNPTTASVSSIRTNAPTGIRFMASVTDSVKTLADEYGFVVARQTSLAAAEKTDADLSFDCGVAVVSGVSYSKADGIDKVYNYDDENGLSYFTGVLVGIPEGMEQDVLVARPYVKIDSTYYYGDTIAKSIYEIAVAVKAGGYTGLDANGIAAIDAIISRVAA